MYINKTTKRQSVRYFIYVQGVRNSENMFILRSGAGCHRGIRRNLT